MSRVNRLMYVRGNYTTHQQVLTGIEVDIMQRERPTKTRIFRAEINYDAVKIRTQSTSITGI